MLSVVLLGSSTAYDTAMQLQKRLESQGYTVYAPSFDHDERYVNVTAKDKAYLTRRAFAMIALADLVYVIDEKGHTGVSVCLEIGYAVALDRRVILSEPPTELAVAALADHIIPVGDFPAWCEQL